MTSHKIDMLMRRLRKIDLKMTILRNQQTYCVETIAAITKQRKQLRKIL